MQKEFLQLGRKHWQESKTRFIIAAVLLAAIIFYAVSQSGSTISQHPSTHAGRQINFTQYVWVILYKGYFLTIFTVAAFVFGLGGPTQEKQSGSALFTFSLPVYRSTVLRSKILVAAAQVVALSLLAAFFIPVVAALFRLQYPLKDALLFSSLMSSGGLLFMLLGICLSLFISRQLLAAPLGAAIMGALFFVTKLPALKELNVFNFMCGAGYLSNADFLFNQDINLAGIGVLVSLGIIFSLALEIFFKRMDI